MIKIEFDRGTLLVKGDEYSYIIQNIGHCKWDPRTRCFRLPACQYHRLIYELYQQNIPYEDNAKKYEKLDNLIFKLDKEPFPYQKEAINSWVNNGKRGVVVLPTGTGKSLVGVLAIATAKRSTLVVVPTIDLMHQWYDILKSYFPSTNIGVIGGGMYEVDSLTVITYDSAYRHLENIGNKFGLIIFDECHHLPSGSYQLSAQFSLAPYRLGLSATPERVDNAHYDLIYLIGPFVYRKNISEMSGNYLANYEIIQLKADLSPEEREEYKKNRKIYLDFLRKHNIRMGSGGWSRFIKLCAKSVEGRKAFISYLRQKELALAASSKIRILSNLIKKHHNEKIIIFTNDNATAYKISSQFLVPVITHQTKAKERREYLIGFNEGKYNILATSKVLNEGVNIPAANIGIVLSGSGSVREHVQRLGRILRKYNNKKAILYEIVAKDTAEEFVSKRRRKHEAYNKKIN